MQLDDSLKARYLCLQILIGVFKEDRSVVQILQKKSVYGTFYRECDVAKAKRLSNFIFIHLKQVDQCIEPHLNKNIKLEVRNIFRVVVAESTDKGLPDYAIVNSAVKLAKLNKVSRYFTTLINAVSRKIVLNLKSNNQVFEPELEKNLRAYLRKYYAEEVIKKIEKLMIRYVPVDITVRDSEDISLLKKELGAVELPTGTLRLKNQKVLAELEGFKTGKWWVQGISSAIPVKLLGNIYGLEVLDLFSAPGGKAMQLISAGAIVSCLDISSKRLELLKQNLVRMEMNAEIIRADIGKFKTNKKYDLILIDAPCSASGTIRKNKDLIHLNPMERIYNLKKIQGYALEAAKSWVKDSGRILYSTCSLFPEEGEEQIKNFLIKNKDWMQKVICADNFGLDEDWLDKNGALRLRPDHLFDLGGIDGFYASLLIKKQFH